MYSSWTWLDNTVHAFSFIGFIVYTVYRVLKADRVFTANPRNAKIIARGVDSGHRLVDLHVDFGRSGDAYPVAWAEFSLRLSDRKQSPHRIDHFDRAPLLLLLRHEATSARAEETRGGKKEEVICTCKLRQRE